MMTPVAWMVRYRRRVVAAEIMSRATVSFLLFLQQKLNEYLAARSSVSKVSLSLLIAYLSFLSVFKVLKTWLIDKGH